MTLKQRLHFGSARQRTAAKRALSEKRHRKATPRKRNSPRHAHTARRRNLGEEVFIFGANPARKRRNGMAGTKRRVQHRAGTRRRTMRRYEANPRRRMKNVRSRHQRNPGGRVTGYLVSGAAVVAGAVGPKAATQMVLGDSNTGAMGYLGNGVATGLLGWGAHMLFRDKTISQMVIAGGIAQILVRFMTNSTPYGSYLSNAGVGDYMMNWNYTAPQRVMPGYPPTQLAVAPGWGPAPAALPAPGGKTAVVTHSTGVGALYNPSWN